MNPEDIRIGDVVFSKAGRDKGNYFMVYSIVDEEFILTVDGDKRKQAAPKKKRRKHVKATGTSLSSIAQKLSTGLHVFDAEIRKALNDTGLNNPDGATKKEG